VYWLGKPAVIRPAEIETIKKFVGDYDEVEIEFTRTPIVPGTKVRLRQGIMMGREAIARSLHNKLLTVEIESLGALMKTTVPMESVEVINLPGIYK
jgi:transcription antitermination factor NusG